MSNTRRAEPGNALRQERWSSSEEFERGLLANLVARRCQTLNNPEERALIWFVQKLSHERNGLACLADELLGKFADKLGTKSMRRFGVRTGQKYNAEQVKQVRGEFPIHERHGLLLKGELDVLDILTAEERESSLDIVQKMIQESEHDAYLRRDGIYNKVWQKPGFQPTRVAIEAKECFEQCLYIAEGNESEGLEADLQRLCLDPSVKLANGWPWYFHELPDCLRAIRAKRVAAVTQSTVVTAIGQSVYETLDYALGSKCMVLIDGQARIGKSFAAKTWCDSHPGQARYVQVPSTNDDVGFFRAIAKALGVCCGRAWKAVQLRQRIEDVLQAGDLILVMDEAHYLWPISDCKNRLPSRITWVMTALVNQGVPVALVTTPQFIATQKAVEKRTHWTSEQFIGRIGHYVPLPSVLDEGDLSKVAKHVLPEGDSKSIEMLVRYAGGSAKYLAGIEAIVRRARYLAAKDKRNQVDRGDVRRAIKESVIPSDSALANALSTAEQNRSRGRKTAPPLPAFNGHLSGLKSDVQRPSETEFEDSTPSRIAPGLLTVG